MMSACDLRDYFSRHKLSASAQDYIRTTRGSEPSRLIGVGARGNIVGWKSSGKMGRSIGAESHTAEMVFVKECEFNDSVIEYYDQPPAVDICATIKGGRRRRRPYTADYLVLRTDGAWVVEVKRREQLESLIETQPANWVKIKDGYRFNPAAEAFSELGIPHEVAAYDASDNVLSANLNVILQAPALSENKLEALERRYTKLFAPAAWMTIDELADLAKLNNLEEIFALIRAKKLHCAIDIQPLWVTSVARIARRPELLQLALSPDLKNSLDEDTAVPLTVVPTSQAAEAALRSLERLKTHPNDRQNRRIRQRIREGAKEGLSPFQALIPKYHHRGNRTPRLNESVKTFLGAYIDHNFSNSRSLSDTAGYGEYCTLAEEQHPGWHPVCKRTFRCAVNAQDPVKKAQGRGGRRAANAARAPSPTKSRAIRRTVPFAAATIDHYNVDLLVVIAEQLKKIFTARCWLSALVDLTTRQLLAYYFSLMPPSRVACAMVIRDCIRRHEKIPSIIMSDGGPEFESHYYHSLLAHLGVDLMRRPPSDSRYGSEVERFFGAFKTQCLGYLPGVIQGVRYDRGKSRTHSPDHTAALTPAELLSRFDTYAQWRHSTLVGSELLTSSQQVQQNAQRFEFVGIPTKLDEAMMIITAVDQHRYKVDPQRGVHTGSGHHFWHPLLATLPCNSSVDTRLDPEDPYRIYARINDKWHVCTNQLEIAFAQKPPLERQVDALLSNKPNHMKDDIKEWAQRKLIKKLSAHGEPEKLPVEPPANGPSRRDLFADAQSGIDEPEIEIQSWAHR